MSTPATVRSRRSQRWDLLGRYRVWVGGTLLLDRLRFLQNPLFAVLLTRIHGPDADRWPHNHSRSFVTVCLTGSYTEVRYRPGDLSRSCMLRHRRLRPYYMPHLVPHKIIATEDRLRTVVLAGRHHGTFWFWTPSGPVDYRDA